MQNVLFEPESKQPLLFTDFMENNTVRFINFHLFAIHDKKSSLQIHSKECHGIRLMIQRYQMPVIRKKRRILWIVSADRETEKLMKHAACVINLINNDAASTSSKNKKAKELGVDIITEEEFRNLVNSEDLV